MKTEILTVGDTPWANDPEEVMATALRQLDAQLSADEHPLGDWRFFEGNSIQELGRTQGVGPVEDIRVFAGGIPDDEDVNEMLDEIYRLREP